MATFRPFAAAAATAFGLALALPATAGPVSFGQGWKEQKFSLFSNNSYSYSASAVEIASDAEVSLIWKPVARGDWRARRASWDWSVSQSVPATDLTRKGGDDRNLALYFVFLPEAQAEQMQDASVRRLLAADAARVLVYVWGGAAGRGAVLPSPYLGARGKTVIRRPAGTGSFSENVDLAGDYARAFGGSPGALVGLAVSADSDDTNSAVRARLSGLVLN